FHQGVVANRFENCIDRIVTKNPPALSRGKRTVPVLPTILQIGRKRKNIIGLFLRFLQFFLNSNRQIRVCYRPHKTEKPPFQCIILKKEV
uniref:hypothetical protein n=1 Tax=Klebsiella pneumoniae TaxID=573 RepID=UPI0025A1AD1E